jgi:hypothetical protein
MSTRFGLICAATVVMLTGAVADTATAQVISISSVGYTAPVVAPPKKASSTPNGTMSLPGDGKTYRVYCDFGTLTMGNFAADATVSAGGSSGVTITIAGGNSNWTTALTGPFELTNPPANHYCRARLQRLKNDGVTWEDLAGTEQYALCPP